MPATLFFDLDGTLCHPRTPFFQIFFASCAPLLDSPSPDVPTLLNAWAETLEMPGPSTTAGCLARALAVCGISASERLVEQCARSLVADWAAAQELAAGVLETLERLAQTHPLGLITNGPSDAQHAVLETLGLAGVLRWRIVSGDTDVGIRKPNSGIFAHALTLSGSPPQDTWYIGDSPVNDIAGAKDAGWRACWLASADRDFPADRAAPDARISRLDELLRVIGRYA